MTELTGWKPIPQECCDSNCLADAKFEFCIFFWTAVTCHRFALQCEALFQQHRNLHRIANNWRQVEKYQSGDESPHSKKCKTRTKQGRIICAAEDRSVKDGKTLNAQPSG
jgi:hypothetical protein